MNGNERLAAVKAILERRQFKSFIGWTEDEFFDAKRKQGYDLDDKRYRYELAKDVSSFANSSGGYIIIGLATAVDPTQKTEKVTAVDFLDQAALNTEKFKGIIREYVYPLINGLSVEWVEDTDSAGLGIVSIFIPPQDEDNKPYIINRIVEEDIEIKQIVVGIAKRKSSSSEPLTAQQLQEFFRKGSDTVARNLSSINEKLDVLLESRKVTEGESAPSEEIEDRIRSIHES